jgi:hypothetical protein
LPPDLLLPLTPLQQDAHLRDHVPASLAQVEITYR